MQPFCVCWMSNEKKHNVHLLNPAVVAINLANISWQLQSDCCDRQEYSSQWKMASLFTIEWSHSCLTIQQEHTFSLMRRIRQKALRLLVPCWSHTCWQTRSLSETTCRPSFILHYLQWKLHHLLYQWLVVSSQHALMMIPYLLATSHANIESIIKVQQAFPSLNPDEHPTYNNSAGAALVSQDSFHHKWPAHI